MQFKKIPINPKSLYAQSSKISNNLTNQVFALKNINVSLNKILIMTSHPNPGNPLYQLMTFKSLNNWEKENLVMS